MAKINTFTIGGNVVANPEVHTYKNGNSYYNYRLAVNEGKDRTSFIPVKGNGKPPKTLVKGAAMFVEGYVENIPYTDKNGKKTSFFTMIASKMALGQRGSFNNGTLMGNLTAKPELRHTKAGKAVTSFTIATNQSYKDKASGEWKESATSFINCVAWEAQAEFIAKYFDKGNPIIVGGGLSSREYDKDGGKRTAYECVARQVSFASYPKDDAKGETASAATQTADTGASYQVDDYDDYEIADVEDLPF